MAKESPFTVLVRELPTEKSFDVPNALVAEWTVGMPQRDALEAGAQAGHGHAELELYADGTHAFANGTFKGVLVVACSRCVTAVELPIDEQIHVTFMPTSELPAEDTESEEGAEVAAGELDVFPFDGERIDLEPLFREQFVLAVPYAPLCREECQGLCSQCGIDKNTGTCACERPIDPRLAALKGLKLPS